jgi:predicted HicB family RNase H-like nuclease
MRTVTDMANINVTVPDDLHRQVKAAAALEGKSLKDYVIEALAAAVRQQKGRR